MKGKRKLWAILLAGAIGLSGLFAACSPSTEKPGGGDSEFGLATTIDKNRTTLFVSNFNGGFGERWLKAAAKRYETLHKDDVYQDGKKGVQIWIDNGKDGGSTTLNNISNSRDAVFFSEYV